MSAPLWGTNSEIAPDGNDLAVRLDCQPIGTDTDRTDPERSHDRAVGPECSVELAGRRVSSQREGRLVDEGSGPKVTMSPFGSTAEPVAAMTG